MNEGNKENSHQENNPRTITRNEYVMGKKHLDLERVYKVKEVIPAAPNEKYVKLLLEGRITPVSSEDIYTLSEANEVYQNNQAMIDNINKQLGELTGEAYDKVRLNTLMLLASENYYPGENAAFTSGALVEPIMSQYNMKPSPYFNGSLWEHTIWNVMREAEDVAKRIIAADKYRRDNPPPRH